MHEYMYKNTSLSFDDGIIYKTSEICRTMKFQKICQAVHAKIEGPLSVHSVKKIQRMAFLNFSKTILILDFFLLISDPLCMPLVMYIKVKTIHTENSQIGRKWN